MMHAMTYFTRKEITRMSSKKKFIRGKVNLRDFPMFKHIANMYLNFDKEMFFRLKTTIRVINVVKLTGSLMFLVAQHLLSLHVIT